MIRWKAALLVLAGLTLRAGAQPDSRHVAAGPARAHLVRRAGRDGEARGPLQLEPDYQARVLVGPGGDLQLTGAGMDYAPRSLGQASAESIGFQNLSQGISTTAPQLSHDGKVVVANAAISESLRLQIEANNEECMLDTPMYKCYEKFGSYGIRRLFTESWEDIMKLGYIRPTWMAHPNVQRRRLFNVTFPGTHNSGTYDFKGHSILGTGLAFGAQNQHLSVDKQLELGIRAFDFRVSYEPTEKRLYLSHGLLTVPLADVLGQIRAFLDLRPKEVILVHAKVGRTSHNLDARYRDIIIAEDTDPTKVPGQMVHRLFLYHLGSLLATYATLSRLPMGENLENPHIGNLVAINARVIYFWEGQQVLCTDRHSCQRTPGWTRPWSGLAFGWPLPLGVRQRHVGRSTRTVEPGCMSSSWENTASAHPDWVVKKIRSWLFDVRVLTANSAPACFPDKTPIPELQSPTLLYWADCLVTLSETEDNAQRLLMGQTKAFFTRGEGFGLMSSAERVNYLMLVWLMKQGAAPLWTRANVIAHDFASPILVHRIVEAMQEQQDCGWAIHCKVTGSCWAASLLGEDGACMNEADAQAVLEEHALTKGMGFNLKVFLAFLWLVIICLLVCCVCLLCRRGHSSGKAAEPAGDGSAAEPTAAADQAAEPAVGDSAQGGGEAGSAPPR